MFLISDKAPYFHTHPGLWGDCCSTHSHKISLLVGCCPKGGRECAFIMTQARHCQLEINVCAGLEDRHIRCEQYHTLERGQKFSIMSPRVALFVCIHKDEIPQVIVQLLGTSEIHLSCGKYCPNISPRDFIFIQTHEHMIPNKIH